MARTIPTGRLPASSHSSMCGATSDRGELPDRQLEGDVLLARPEVHRTLLSDSLRILSQPVSPARRRAQRPAEVRGRPTSSRWPPQLFAERGYGGTSVDDVGTRLGVSGPAVYWHFASKEALLTQMLADISDRLLAGGSDASPRRPTTTRRCGT